MLNLTEHCPLLRESEADLIALFNQITETVECGDPALKSFFARNVSVPGKNDERLNVADVMSDVRETLTRNRYRIGFVGTYQIGKSSAANTILGQDLLAEGGSGACTSVATVIETQPQGAATQFLVTYFTEEQLVRRFREISQKPDPPCPTAKLPHRHSPEAEQFTRWAEEYAKANKDVEFLKGLVGQFHAQVATPILGSDGLWQTCADTSELRQELARLVQHTDGLDVVELNSASGNGQQVVYPALIREVRVRAFLDGVPDGLELIDLPGLGTTHSYDSDLTTMYVRDLDGLLLFSRSGTPDDVDLVELVTALQGKRDVIKGRNYRVVTRVDESGADTLYGETYFSALSNSNRELELDDEKTRFLSVRAKYGADIVALEDIPKDSLADALCSRPGETPKDTAYGGFQAAFQQYATDGGRQALRSMLETDIKNSVREAVAHEARLKLNFLRDDLAAAIRLALKGGISGAERRLARMVSSELLKCVGSLTSGGIDLNKTAAVEFFESCWKCLNHYITEESVKYAQEWDENPPPEANGESRWIQLHTSFAADIQDICKKTIPEITINIFDVAIKQLDEGCQSMNIRGLNGGETGDHKFPDGDNPFLRMKNEAQRLSGETRFLTDTDSADPIVQEIARDIRQLASSTMIKDGDTGRLNLEHTPAMYVNVMKRKVEEFSYAQVARIRLYARETGRRIDTDLNRIANSTDELGGNLTKDQKTLLEESLRRLKGDSSSS